MDRSPQTSEVIAVAGRCLWLLARYVLLLARYALLTVLAGILRLSRP